MYPNGSTETFTYDKLGNITGHTVTPPAQYSITISHTGFGSLTPTGTVSVTHNDTLTVTATPEVSSYFSSWTVTGGITIIENTATGRFLITGDGTIEARFPLLTFTVSVASGGNGTVTPSGDNTVDYGDDLPITASPATGYHFSHWVPSSGLTVDNSNQAATQVSSVTASGTVTAFFNINTYTVTVSSGGNGTVSPAGDNTVDYGDDLTITAEPADGCHFIRWDAENVTVADNTAQSTIVSDVTVSGTVTAVFAVDINPGSIAVSGLSGNAEVFLYSTSGWIGQKVLTGNGTISNVLPGYYYIAVKESGSRVYRERVTVNGNTTTSITVTTAGNVPLGFTEIDTIKDDNNVVISGSQFSSAVIDDIDRDGDGDLYLVTQGGTAYFYENESGYQLENTFSFALSSETVRCIRIVDFNYDNESELLVGLNTGEIFGSTLSGDSIWSFYTAASGLAGFDILDANADNLPDILLGYDNGTLYLAESDGMLSWDSSERLLETDDSPIAIGFSVVPSVIDLTGDGVFDIVYCRGDSSVHWMENNGNGKFLLKGEINTGGLAPRPDYRAAVSVFNGRDNNLPDIVLNDNAGYTYRSNGILQSDITRDGTVDILDLQQLGIKWGLNSDDSGWTGAVNLNLTPDRNGVQVIDILDLQVLGRNWGRVK